MKWCTRFSFFQSALRHIVLPLYFLLEFKKICDQHTDLIKLFHSGAAIHCWEPPIQAVFDRTSHLDSGRRCQCRDLPLHQSGVVAGSRADGGLQKAGCWPLKSMRLEKTLPSCRRSSDCGRLFRSAEVFHPLHLNLQSENIISVDSCLSCTHALNKHCLLSQISERNSNQSHYLINKLLIKMMRGRLCREPNIK